MSKLRKENFSFDISAMVDYIAANETELMSKIVIGSNMTEFVSVFPNVKNAEWVPTFETGDIDSILATGHCDTSFGDIVLDEVELRVCDYNIQKGYCPEKLASTIMGLRLAPGSYNEESGAEERFLEDIVAKAAVATERKIWQGTTASDCVDGINAQLDTASASTVNVTYSAMTPSNSLTIVDSYVTALPEALKFSPTVLFLNRSDYQSLLLALRDANYFHYSVEGQEQAPGSVMIPATNTIAVSSEIGSGRALLTYGKNIAYGTDLLEDTNNADMWYSKDNKQLRMSLQFRAGATVFFPSLCVRIA
jgi:hypothetical protein